MSESVSIFPSRMSSKKHALLWYLFGTLFIGLFLVPVLRLPWFAHPIAPGGGRAQLAIETGLIALCPLIAWCALAGETQRRRDRLAVLALVLSATAICEIVHYWVIDRGHYFSPAQFADNTAWQQFMHNPIIELAAPALPHSYRFMPDIIVHVFTWLCNDFVVARIAYRLLFNALLFVAIYRYARTYVSELLAGVAVVIVVAVYPITILKYAGQLIDPMATFCFIAALACLARRYEPGFGPILFAGLFAKESVIVAAICRAFYGPKRWRSILAAAAYVAVATAILVKIRVVVTVGDNVHTGMKAISGVDLKHVPENLAGYKEWILMYVALFGALLPGAIGGWRFMDRPFRWVAATVVIAALGSTLLFSWMSEVRNVMPAFIVLAILNVVWAERTLVPRAAAALVTRSSRASSASVPASTEGLV